MVPAPGVPMLLSHAAGCSQAECSLLSLFAGHCRCAMQIRCSSWYTWGMHEVLQLRQEPSANSCSGEQCRTGYIGITRDFPLSEVFQLRFTS